MLSSYITFTSMSESAGLESRLELLPYYCEFQIFYAY